MEMIIFEHELKILDDLGDQDVTPQFLVSFDEVGRGCLFGEVVVGCSVFLILSTRNDSDVLPGDLQLAQNQLQTLSKAKDSKSLSKVESVRHATFNELLSACLNPSFAAPSRPSDIIIKGDAVMPDIKQKNKPLAESRVLLYKDILKPPASITQTAGLTATRLTRRSSPPEPKPKTSQKSVLLLYDGFAASTEASYIDAMGITAAINRAAEVALSQVVIALSSFTGMPPSMILENLVIFMDGDQPLSLTNQPAAQVLVVGGDRLLKSIGLSSILAKVARDDKMKVLASIYSDYDLAANKGYGTKKHYAALDKLGTTPQHRSSFIKLKKHNQLPHAKNED